MHRRRDAEYTISLMLMVLRKNTPTGNSKQYSRALRTVATAGADVTPTTSDPLLPAPGCRKDFITYQRNFFTFQKSVDESITGEA